MGKARIIEALGEGQYTIEVVEARERAESAKEQAEARITSLQSDIADLQGDLSAAQQAVDVAAADQNEAIAQYQADMAAEGESSVNLEAAAMAFLEAVSARDQIAVQINVAQARIKLDQALIARVNALPPLRQMQAWCADYTDDLSGEVATAEVPGEIGKVIIKPSSTGNAWSASSDGAMQPALASTPAGAFYNLAMMPGWQKWRPTYRTATITSISGDVCDINLDAESSSQQGLNVNARSSYSDVPILYMDCNGAAFESGDKVLVAFAGNVNEPIVCGFETQPKMCGDYTGCVFIIVNLAKDQVIALMRILDQIMFLEDKEYTGFRVFFYFYADRFEFNSTNTVFQAIYDHKKARKGIFTDFLYTIPALPVEPDPFYAVTELKVTYVDDNHMVDVYENFIASHKIPHNRVHFFHFSQYGLPDWPDRDRFKYKTDYLNAKYGFSQFGNDRFYTGSSQTFLSQYGGDYVYTGPIDSYELYLQIKKIVDQKQLMKPIHKMV